MHRGGNALPRAAASICVQGARVRLVHHRSPNELIVSHRSSLSASTSCSRRARGHVAFNLLASIVHHGHGSRESSSTISAASRPTNLPQSPPLSSQDAPFYRCALTSSTPTSGPRFQRRRQPGHFHFRPISTSSEVRFTPDDTITEVNLNDGRDGGNGSVAVAQLERLSHRNAKLSIVLAATSDRNESFSVNVNTDIRPTRVEVLPPQKSYRVVKVASKIQDSRYLREINNRLTRVEQGVHGIFNVLVRKLSSRTPPLVPQEYAGIVRGAEEDLVEWYHYILNLQTAAIVPEHPVISFGYGYMRFFGDQDTVQKMEGRLSDIAGTQNDVLKYVMSDSKGKWGYKRHSELIHAASALSSVSTRLRYNVEPRPAEDIPYPDSWSKSTLLEYVRAVTRSRRPEQMRLDLENRFMVSACLRTVLFEMPETKHFVTFAALFEGFSFLVSQRDMPAARAFLYQMKLLRFLPSVEFYNFMLRGCAEEQNLVAFDYFLHVMAQARIQPNDGTWTALLVAAPRLRDKQKVARLMEEKGFNAMRSVIRKQGPSVIPFSLGPHLDEGGKLSSYIQALDRIYGVKWLGDSAIESILDALGQRGRLLEAILFVEDNYRRGDIMNNKRALHILLRHCVHHQAADFAVWLLRFAEQRWNLLGKDHIIVKEIFQLGWERHMYNICRVAWKFAVANQDADFDMRQQVETSLRHRVKNENENATQRWLSSIGSVLCLDSLDSSSGQSAWSIIQSERNTFTFARPSKPFTLMLAEALLLDKQWAEGGLRWSTGTAWKIENAIHVPMSHMSKLTKMELPREDWMWHG